MHKDQIDDTTRNLCCTDNGKKDISMIENCHSNKLIYNKDKNDENNNDKEHFRRNHNEVNNIFISHIIYDGNDILVDITN